MIPPREMPVTRLRLVLLFSLLTLGGCASTAGAYVEENSGGYFVVTGQIVDVTDLSTNTWELLSDGIAIVIKESGCQVIVEQLVGEEEKVEKTTFELMSGDHVIHTSDKDYVLSSLKNKAVVGVNTGGTSSGSSDASSETDGE